MDQNLRVLFERALSDEPASPPGDLAQEAMAIGRRRRHRRHLLTGGVAGAVTVLATVVAVNMASTPPATPVAMSLMARPLCGEPAEPAIEVAIFLKPDITDQQRASLAESLRSDPHVLRVRYESKEAAYAKFKEMYRDAPDLVGAVKLRDMPDSFRVTMAASSDRLALQEESERQPGVESVVGKICGQPAKEGE